MKNIELHVPQVNDLWFREKCMTDKQTMEYNSGYDVHFEGYHYDTGCIDFTEDKHQKWYDEKMNNPNFFYAYIFDKDINQFVGYVNFNKNLETNKATMGIVVYSDYKGQGYMRPAMNLLIKNAKEKGVEYLTDTVPETRSIALKVFFELGFKKIKEINGTKFGKPELIYEIEKRL